MKLESEQSKLQLIIEGKLPPRGSDLEDLGLAGSVLAGIYSFQKLSGSAFKPLQVVGETE